jgi:hypothetical protein
MVQGLERSPRPMVLAMMRKLLPTSSQGRVAVLAGIGLLLVAGFLAFRLPGGPVALRTTETPGYGTQYGCYAAGTGGQLVVDAEAGTAVLETEMSQSRVQVTWPRGYTARRSGGEVEVLDRYGEVVARTGTEVHLVGGYENHSFLVCNLEPIR